MKIAVGVLIVLALGRIGYTYITGQSHQDIPPTTKITTTYTAKAQQRTSMPGEDITVYDQSGTEVLALISEDPQYLYMLTGDALIIDIGTSASQRTVDVYDIPSKQKIFTSTYYPSDKKSLLVDNMTLRFLYALDTDGLNTPPANAPSCEAPYNGYVEERTFDLVSKKVNNTGVLSCAYFE